MGLESGSQQKKVDFSNHKHTKIRNGGILYVFLATIHCIHSYSKYVTSCKYLGLPNPANSGTLGTPAKTTMEPDNGHIGRRDFPLGSIISWVSSKLSGSTIGPSAIAWTSFGYCSLGFGLREQLRMETSNKNSWRVGFRGDFTRGSRISCSINGCFVVGLPFLRTNIEWEGLKANYIDFQGDILLLALGRATLWFRRIFFKTKHWVGPTH